MRYKIRLASKKDCAEMLDIYAPYVRNTVISFEFEPPALDVFERRYEMCSAQYPWLVIEQDKRIQGYAYAHHFHERAAFDWTAECSIYLRQDCRGRGLGPALYTCLLETLKLQNYRIAFASICVPNKRSETLHAALGFVQKGLLDNVGYKAGAWHSIAWYALRLSDNTESPKPIRSIGEVTNMTKFANLLKSSLSNLQK